MADEIVPTGRQHAIAESRRRGWFAAASGAVTIVLTFTLGFVPWGAVALGASVWLGWRWLSHRIRSGIRF